VNVAIGEVDKVVQQNAANAEQSVETLGKVSARADEMSLVINDLNNLIYGFRKKFDGGFQTPVILKSGRKNCLPERWFLLFLYSLIFGERCYGASLVQGAIISTLLFRPVS